jgi:hypothetical protein
MRFRCFRRSARRPLRNVRKAFPFSQKNKAQSRRQQRLGGLTALRELSTQTHERLAALDALAEDVTHKTRALENQKYLIERTLIEANRSTRWCGRGTRKLRS